MTAESNPPDDATAQTLNFALGNLGGRQKSWMQHANPSPSDFTVDQNPLPFTVRRRGRPKKVHQVPSNQPVTTATARTTTEPQANITPPSNSTSPQLANVVMRPDVNYATSAVAAFPSPAPSDENMGNALAPALRGGDGSVHADVVQLSPTLANYAPNTPLETVFMDSARLAGSGQKRPTAEGGTRTGKRHNGGPLLEQVQSRSPSVGNTSIGQVPSPQFQHAVQPQPVGRTPPQAQAQAQAQAPAPAPFCPPHTPSQDTAPHPFSVPAEPGYNQHTPRVPQYPAVQTAWYTSEECIHVLNTFHASNPVVPSTDGRRISVLKDAVNHQDWPYLIMHQFYCLHDLNPSTLPVDVQMKPGLDQALRVMRHVLDSNKRLSGPVLHLFSNFPYPLDEIKARWPSGLEVQVQTFLSFVAHARNYEKLKRSCERRRFPPVVGELVYHLALVSTTFQRLVFTAVLRCIWRGVPSNHVQVLHEAQAVELFKQNQADYYERLAFLGNGQYSTLQREQEDRELELQHWGSRFKQLVDALEATTANQGYSVNTPYDTISPYAQQQPVAIQQMPQAIAIEAEMASRGSPQIHPHAARAAIQQSRRQGRPRAQPVPAPNPLPSQLAPQQPQAPVPLLPPLGWVQPQQRAPNPARFSLHQANLRSPMLQAQLIESPLYHYVQGYVKPPARLSNAGQAVERWTFTLDPEMMRCIPGLVGGLPGGPETRTVNTWSKTVRLRCVKWPAKQPPNEHVWSTTDTSWIPYSYFTFNGTFLQQRKKVHHGKDLPIDITGLLREGDNVLETTVMAQSNDTSYHNYLVAIEYLGIISHKSVKRRCLEEQRVSADQVVRNIRNKLSRLSDDDDIAVVESNLTINLFDPFSASKICDIPVRSRACLHSDCFDLETFLTTRRRKGDASVPDLWRCPICNADARPHHLIVDGFLQDVKQDLLARGLPETRAIIVRQDGSWEPKAEVRDPNGVSDRGASGSPPALTITRHSVPAHAEVIDLSD